MKNLTAMTDNELRDYKLEIKEQLNGASRPTTAFSKTNPEACEELLGIMREVTRETWRRWPNIAPSADRLENITELLAEAREKLSALNNSWRTDKIYSLRLRIQEYEDKIAWINGELK